MGANFLHQAANTFLGAGLIKVPVEHAHEDLMDMV
jgi:hypothetical protein